MSNIPYSIAWFMASTLGMILLFMILVTLIFYSSNPILPIMFAIFAWQFVTKSIKVSNSVVATLQFTPIEEEKRAKYMQNMTSPKEITLEEEVVANVAPNTGNQYIESTFAPIAENIHNAFYLKSSTM